MGGGDVVMPPRPGTSLEVVQAEAMLEFAVVVLDAPELLASRGEERVTLLVNPKAGGGKVQAVYERWGYGKIGEQQPFADSPVFAAMMRDPLHRG
ncbi:hypothetical protein SALBM311S_06075 [Streptomyces alboniger]